MCQSVSRRGRTMLRLSLLVILLTHRIRTAHVTQTPFSNRYDKLFQKLEKLTVAPDRSPSERLDEKLDRLNALADDRDLTEEEEELLSLMTDFGDLSAEQITGVVKDLQRMKEEVSEQEYSDAAWDDEDLPDLAEGDYPMDGNDNDNDWDSEDLADSSATSKPVLGVTPSAFTRTATVKVSAAETIAATNARPRILDEPSTAVERAALRRAAMRSMSNLLHSGKCLVPQPRWLTVRQLAPAADTRYLPPCVQLHRCAPDSGCCLNEGEVCAPIDGKTVVFPFFLHKANGQMNVVRMQFFNHTQCACVSRDTYQMTITPRAGKASYSDSQDSQEEDRPSRRPLGDSQSDWRPPTEEPMLDKDNVPTAPPQLRRCTCPGLFLANMKDNEPCTCICDWPDAGRRRDCTHLAKGREHFGLRDRVCVARGDCSPPTCEYGAFDRVNGKCPERRYRRTRYHARRYQDKPMVL
ncbi:uncharacterized protein LOC113497749 [Trichoplusia ni]|uniref:Uncharacterized protein LOC113497749 n=1 Tax=Trichoplusia ni TaxID=7111 RepID=A0A7E5VYQ8_TRINI|nr:uncharacterized protein LOC113497749 [Trichoplusia ni]